MQKLFIPGRPIPKGRPRFYRGRAITPAATKKYQTHVAKCAKLSSLKSYGKARVAMYIQLRMVRKPGGQPDVENISKSICDALNKMAYNDDAQIEALVITRQWVSKGQSESATVHVAELDMDAMDDVEQGLLDVLSEHTEG